MHLGDEQIQRIMHGEVFGPVKADISRHLDECEPCRLLLKEARNEEERIFGLLAQIDLPLPPVDPATLIAGASRRRPGWGRWAAGVLLGLAAAGAAYAAPGSPLPGWVTRIEDWIARPLAAPGPPTQPETGNPVSAGIAVAPGQRFVIQFRAGQPVGRISVSVGKGPDIVLRAENGTVAFTTDTHRLTVENVGATADYEIELPRAAPWVEIWVGERRVLLKQGDRTVTDATPEPRGRYVLPVGP